MTGDRAPANALVLVGEDVDLEESGVGIMTLVESLGRSGAFPSVLVDTGVRHDLLDELRVRGVPVMQRRSLGEVPLRGLHSRLELLHWLRASDADVVYVAAVDRRRKPCIRRVRRIARLAPRVCDVVEVSLDDGPSSGRPR